MDLRLSQRDLEAGTLRLEPSTTKNSEIRTAYLTSELEILWREQKDRVMASSRTLGRVLCWLFAHLSGCYAGTPRRGFRIAEAKAMKHSSLSGRLEHDFQHTAVRDKVRAGMLRSAVMKITGHQTESVYRPYAIVSDADLQEATRQLTSTMHAQ